MPQFPFPDDPLLRHSKFRYVSVAADPKINGVDDPPDGGRGWRAHQSNLTPLIMID